MDNMIIAMILNFISSYCLGVLASSNKNRVLRGLHGWLIILFIVIFSITSVYILAEIYKLNLCFKG